MMRRCLFTFFHACFYRHRCERRPTPGVFREALRHLAAAESSGLFNQDADSVDGQPTDEIPLKKD